MTGLHRLIRQIGLPILCCYYLTNNALYAQVDSIGVALGIIDLSFTNGQIDSMRAEVRSQRQYLEEIRSVPYPNNMPYPLIFTPPLNTSRLTTLQQDVIWPVDTFLQVPGDMTDLATYSVYKLAALIRTKQITSVELTQYFLDRLRTYGDTLECVITITDSLAMAQAARADRELANGIYHGALHGIPYGAKDLIAVPGYRTTWGAAPYRDQVLEEQATVITKLEEAGAVLIAKLTLGALAWGDVWFDGKTRNPWNLSQGSSGSSAGSASATAAGLVPFAIGSETWGSIVSPSTRCGTTGLRPTFGRVSRHGAMALSWTMDKLGPICRNAIDCAIVFDAIRGSDGKDVSVTDVPFNYRFTDDTQSLRVGILAGEFRESEFNFKNDSVLLSLLTQSGIEFVEKELPADIPLLPLRIILRAEAAAVFDDLTRSGRDTLLVSQIANAWPTLFRATRLIPAVEYIQANRLRYQLTMEFNTLMEDIDVLIAPSFSDQLLMTNLTGHPCVVLPDGSYANGNGGSITLIGNHFDEASILEFATYIQGLTPYEDRIPDLFK